MDVMPFDGSVPMRKGRERSYPLHTMGVGQFFFLPGRTRGNMASYVSHQGRKLNRKFATRSLLMRQDAAGLWVVAQPGEAGAIKGLAIYRTE